MAVFSGLTLFAAAAVSTFERVTRKRPEGEAPRPANEGSSPGAKLDFRALVWRNEYACGNPTIDSQHRRLFATGNALLDAMRAAQLSPEFRRLLHELVRDFDEHCRTEERILGATNDGAAEAHKQIHQQLRGKASTLLKHCSEGKVEIGEAISFLTHDLIASHIVNEVSNGFAADSTADVSRGPPVDLSVT